VCMWKLPTNQANSLKNASWWIGTIISILAIAGIYYAAKNDVDPVDFLKNISKKNNGSDDVKEN